MPTSLSTTLKKVDSMSYDNQLIVKEYTKHLQSKDHKSDRNIVNQLTLLISLDKFYQGIPFTSINSKEQILKFLKNHFKDGKWVERECDSEGRYISSWNYHLGVIKIFFRWLTNKESNTEWETPSFLKIKLKKPLRDSPYGINDIWELDEVLTIVSYEPEIRNQAIITLLWDLDARNHEITALRIKDVILREQYGEGIIPSNTKTGGGPILLTSSFTYVRDWINKHPFKNEPDAKLICSLINGTSVNAQIIWEVLKQLKLRIKRLIESGSITDKQQRQKLEYFLKTKKWNPYCFRHSAITNDSDHLPDFALKKKVRWSMNSQQGKRYIKSRMGDELKNKILELSGIKLAVDKPVSVQRICGRCGYTNSLQNKFCEKLGCNYPLTQLAFDEIKSAELAKDKKIYDLEERMAKMSDLVEKLNGYVELYKPAFDTVMKQLNPHLSGKFIDID
ncbi:MAG: hypothetical protein WBZ36_26310 [Candidatus Nitrosopolaris sp.]